jgi:hypothetical protein
MKRRTRIISIDFVSMLPEMDRVVPSLDVEAYIQSFMVEGSNTHISYATSAPPPHHFIFLLHQMFSFILHSTWRRFRFLPRAKLNHPHNHHSSQFHSLKITQHTAIQTSVKFQCQSPARMQTNGAFKQVEWADWRPLNQNPMMHLPSWDISKQSL